MKIFILSIVLLGFDILASPVGVCISNNSGRAFWISMFGKEHRSFDGDHYEQFPITTLEVLSGSSAFISFTKIADEELIPKVMFSAFGGFSYSCNPNFKFSNKYLYEMNITLNYGYFPAPYVGCEIRQIEHN